MLAFFSRRYDRTSRVTVGVPVDVFHVLFKRHASFERGFPTPHAPGQVSVVIPPLVKRQRQADAAHPLLRRVSEAAVVVAVMEALQTRIAFARARHALPHVIGFPADEEGDEEEEEEEEEEVGDSRRE